jgi:sugar phosphate isomerase/epimerase
LRIGVDSYSYHRLLGECRPGEVRATEPFVRGSFDVLAEAADLALDAVALETCYLPSPSRLDVRELQNAAGALELVLSWGAPNGLEFGANDRALLDLLEWLDIAVPLGVRLMRIVVAGPSLRGAEPVDAQLDRTVRPLAVACERAHRLGVQLALENHGDLTAGELSDLIERVGDPVLGVCFDTANALRVGDDVVEAASLLAPLVRMVHLKDCEPLERVSDPVAGPRSVAYGEGVVPLEAVLAALREGGFDDLVCVEIAQLGPGDDERALVRSCVRWLGERVGSQRWDERGERRGAYVRDRV